MGTHAASDIWELNRSSSGDGRQATRAKVANTMKSTDIMKGRHRTDLCLQRPLWIAVIDALFGGNFLLLQQWIPNWSYFSTHSRLSILCYVCGRPFRFALV